MHWQVTDPFTTSSLLSPSAFIILNSCHILHTQPERFCCCLSPKDGSDQVSSSFQCSANYNTPSFSTSSARKSYRHVVKRATTPQGWKTRTSASRANLQGRLQAIGITKDPRTMAWASNKLQVNLQALRIRKLFLRLFPDRRNTRLELLKQYFRGQNRNVISANRCS